MSSLYQFSRLVDKFVEKIHLVEKRQEVRSVKVRQIENVGSENKTYRETEKRERKNPLFLILSLQLGYSNVPLRPTLSAFPLAWSWTYCLRSIRTFCLIRTAR